MPEKDPIYAPYFCENNNSERCDQTVYQSVPARGTLNKNMSDLGKAQPQLSD